MSISPKSSQAQVRFRDGDDLVEFEGSRKAPTESTKATSETEPTSQTKVKVRKTSKKSGEKADTSATSPVKVRKTTSDSSENESSKGRNPDQSAKSVEASSSAKPPQPPPPPPVRKLSININTDDEPRLSTSERSEELKLKYYSAFQTINRVHGGAIMKIRVGTAGATPAKDAFPIFGAGKRFTCLHWDAECTPADWCIAYYSDTPEWFVRSLAAVGDVSASSEYVSQTITSGPTLVESSLFPLPSLAKALKIVKLSCISDIYVDSSSIKLYCDREVVQLTPVSAYNPLSRRPSCWADAVYSAQHMLIETPEYVMLYKTEFVAILAQHTLGDTRTVEVPPSDGQVPVDSGAAPNTNTGTGTGAGLATLLAPLSPSRPGMLRRRSTLSSFFGVGASKPLSTEEGDDTKTNGSNTANNTTNNNENIENTPEGGSPRRKMSLLGAVKMVRGALKRSVSAPKDVFSAHTRRERSTSGDSITGSGSGINGISNSNMKSSSSVSSDGGRERSQSVHSVHSETSTSFLSQSALSTLFNTGQLIPDATNDDAAHTVDILPHRQSLPDALQAQIHALQAENRLLQQTLTDNNIRSPSIDLTERVQNMHITPTSTNSNTTHTISPYTSDSEYSYTNNSKPFATHTTNTTNSTDNTTPTTLPRDKPYTTAELSTLRAFTSRSNFHQNKNTVKNTTRAFASNTYSSSTAINTTNKYKTLTPQHVHQHYGPGARPPPPPPLTHVLGKQTVLDLLLSQSPTNINTTTAHAINHTADTAKTNATSTNTKYTNTNNNANTSVNVHKAALLHTIGDDYYNDTIELEAQQIVQLVELHKLQQAHARRAELGIGASSGVGGGSSGMMNSITKSSMYGSGVSTGSGGAGTNVVPALRMDENDCAVPILETYETYDSDVYDNTHTTYPHTQYNTDYTHTNTNTASHGDTLSKRAHTVRDATSAIPRSANGSAADLMAIAASSSLLPAASKANASTSTSTTATFSTNTFNTIAGHKTSNTNSTSNYTNVKTSLGAGIQGRSVDTTPNTIHSAYNTHTTHTTPPPPRTHPVVDFITSESEVPGQPRTTLKEQQSRRQSNGVTKGVTPVGHQLVQSLQHSAHIHSTTHTTHGTHKTAKISAQAQSAASAQREQKLLSILSAADSNAHTTHTTHSAPTTPGSSSGALHQAQAQMYSSDEEHKSDVYRSRNNSTTSATERHTAHITTTTHNSANTSNTSNSTNTNTNTTRRNISPQRKGFLARMSNNSSNKGNSSGSVSGLGSGLLMHSAAPHSTNSNASGGSGAVTKNSPNKRTTHTTHTSKARSYSADDSEHNSEHTPTTHAAHTALPHTAHYTTTTETSDSDTLHHLKPPQWSNSYYYHKQKAHSTSPSKPKKSKQLTEKDHKNPTLSPGGDLINPTELYREPKRIITALCTDGTLQCGLFNKTQLTVYVSALHGRVCYVSETGVLPLAAGLYKQENQFLMLQTDADVLVVPLSGVAAAELDTNNTGLFKLSFSTTTTQSKHNTPTATPTSSSDPLNTSSGVIGRLVADFQSANSSSVNNTTNTTDTVNTTTARGGRRAVSVVLKAQDTLALVDWLTVLLDLKYVPVKK